MSLLRQGDVPERKNLSLGALPCVNCMQKAPNGRDVALHWSLAIRCWFGCPLICLVVVLLIGLFWAPAPAHASCTFSTGNINFGTVNLSSGAAVDTTLTLTLTCGTKGKERNCLSHDGGSNVDGTSRRMLVGGNYLRYQLYSDSGRTTVWGSHVTGYAGGGTTIDTTGGTVTATVYARILAGQQSVQGNTGYTDTVAYVYTSKSEPPAPTPCPNATSDVTTSGNMTVTANVTAACSVSANALNFGTVGVLTSAVNATTTVSVQCTSGTAYTIGLSAGSGTGATVAARKMTLSGSTVTYSLYRDSGRTLVWGTTVGTDTVAGTGTGSAVSHTVYGRAPAQSTPAPGAYSDTIVVTLTY